MAKSAKKSAAKKSKSPPAKSVPVKPAPQKVVEKSKPIVQKPPTPAEVPVIVEVPKEEPVKEQAKELVKEPSEMAIREIMIQKSVDREKAIEILKNPTAHK